jgi:hypothetical protein
MYKILLILVITFSAATSFAQTLLPLPDKLPEHVGDITFDPKIDDPHFQVCYPEYVYQYYGLNTSYVGGAKAIKKFMFSHFKYEPAFSTATGYITIRFVVNCKGETGWFRIKQIDKHYEHIQFNKNMIDQLLDLTKKLNCWIPGKINGVNCDTYYYLNFKLIDGHLKDITP